MHELLIRAFRRTRFVEVLNLKLSLRVGNRRFRVPVMCGVVLAGIDEPWMIELLKHLLKHTSGLFVDVGINIGQTLAVVKTVAPSRHYMGFEPNPVCVSYVHELIRLNGLADCTIVPAALHREDALLKLDLYHTYPADGTASIVENFRKDRSVVQRLIVPAYRFDNLGKYFGPLDIGVVKMDVEGAELDVLKGMRTAVEKNRPVIMMEVLPVYSSVNEDRLRRQEELEGELRTLGYALLRVRKDGRRFAGLENVPYIGIHGDLTRCDYVCLPRERRENLCAGAAVG